MGKLRRTNWTGIPQFLFVHKARSDLTTAYSILGGAHIVTDFWQNPGNCFELDISFFFLDP